MNLNRNKWYVRWYFWSLGILDEFLERGDTASLKEERGTNLCAFMRLILFSAPLVLLATTIVYATALASITVLPIWLFGLKGYGIIMGAVGVLYVAVLLISSLSDKWAEKRLSIKEQPVETTSTDVGFFHVLRKWLGAKKQKVCPLVTFVKNEKEVQQ